MSDETMKQKLEEAGKKAEEQKRERQARTVKGSHLKGAIDKLIEDSGLRTKDNTGFLIVFGKENGRKLAVQKKGGRIDLSGFTFEDPAITQISADDAKAKHLGKVRAQVNFEANDTDVIVAVTRCIAFLLEEPAQETKDRDETQAAAAAQ